MGDTHSYEHRGIAPRALGQLFHEISSRVEYEYRVSCTYLELYGEKIFDLLKDLSNPNQDGEYILTEEKDGRGIHVRGLNEIPIENENDALNLLFSGELCKTIAQHKLNRRSNRSHSIFTIYLQQRQKSDLNEKVIHSKLHLVDLAGSERLKKTLDNQLSGLNNFDEVTKKESMSINQSLTYLEQCVVALARKSSHIPYRQSKLTNILKDALGSNCNTLMIACIWGESSHLEETISTLRLASRMMKVENETSLIETIDSTTLIKKQAKLIKALKQELLMHDALVERTGIGYEPYTPEQQISIRKILESYVDSNDELHEEEILFNSIDSYRKILEVCKQFKKMVLGLKQELKTVKEEAYAAAAAQYEYPSPSTQGRGGIGNGGGGGGGGKIGGGVTYGSDYLNSTGGVGDFETTGGFGGGGGGGYDSSNGPIYVGDDDLSTTGRKGFGLGTAPSDSTPSGPNADTLNFKGKNFSSAAASQIKDSGNNFLSQSMPSPSSNPIRRVDFSSAGNGKEQGNGNGNDSPVGPSIKSNKGNGKSLDDFIRSEFGSKLHEDLLNSKKILKEMKQRNKECVQAVNSAKQNIDRLQNELDVKKSERIALFKSSGFQFGGGGGGGGGGSHDIGSGNEERNEIIDEEEYHVMKELKEVKRTYKNRYEQLMKLKSLLNSMVEDTEKKRNLFADEFAAWSTGTGTGIPGGGGGGGTGIGEGNGGGGGGYNKSGIERTFSDEVMSADQLDDQEAFEKLEMERVISQDPDSLAFFNAQKTRRAHVTQNGSTIRQIHKNKRLG
jgi:kinesin family member 6/9